MIGKKLQHCVLVAAMATGMAGQAPALAQPVYPVGETVRYAIKTLIGIKVGEASLSFKGLTQLNGQDVYHIRFKSETLNFLDEETIYADKTDLFPIKVVRNLNIWGKKEKITEHYDQKKGVITIRKEADGEVSSQTIEKKTPIDNIYCFIYRYRLQGQFDPKQNIRIHLPTKDVTVKFIKSMKLKAAGQAFEAFFLRTDPAEYKLWFSQDELHIPLRIDGSHGLTNVAMVMSEYHPPGIDTVGLEKKHAP